MTPLKDAVAARVARAVVRLPRLGGQGVVVSGGFVVTAAHCIAWSSEGMMALRDYYVEEITAADGRGFRVQPLAVEPISDVAVLGVLDGQVSEEFAQAADAFEDFCATVEPVPLEISDRDLFVPSPAYIFTHDKGVIAARAEQCAFGSACLAIEVDEPIEGGTSGGPVVTSRGRLLGIVSNSGGDDREKRQRGSIPRVHVAVPAWLVRQMVPRAVARKLDAVFPPGRWNPKRGVKAKQT